MAAAVPDSNMAMKRDEKMTETASVESSPFTEEFAPQNFHPEIGRLNLLKNIRQDLAEGVPIVVVTGEPGCGKSAFGEMLASETINGTKLIYFGKSVISFENVVKSIARIVEVEVTDFSRKGVALAVDEIADRAELLPERLALVFDGAERIYLATLERIRKMLDRINIQAVRMQVLFLGRAGLLDNLKQLSICNLNEVPEKHYALQPLSKSETALYIEMCTARLPQADASLFTTEAVDSIFLASRGNFRKIKQCAEEVLKRRNGDASFYVLLDNEEGDGTGPVKGGKLRRSIAALSGSWSRTGVIAGGALAATLAVGLLLTTGKNVADTGSVTPVGPVESSVKQQAIPVEQSSNTSEPTSVKRQLTASVPAGSLMNSTAENDAEPGMETGNHTVKVKEAQAKKLVTSDAEEAAVIADTGDGVEQIQVAQLPPEPNRAARDEGHDGQKEQVVVPLAAGADEPVTGIPRIEPQRLAKKNLVPASEVVETIPLIPQQAKKVVAETPPAPEVATEVEAAAGEQAVSSSQVAGESVTGNFSVEDVDEIFSLPFSGPIPQQGTQPAVEQEASTESLASQQETGEATVAPDAEVAEEKVAENISAPSESKKVVVPAEVSVARINSGNVKTKTAPVVSSADVEKATVARPEPGTDQGAENLYRNRLAAGENWLNGKGESKYTMQLMVLSAENARDNIERMLDSKEYRQEAANFYIFEGSQDPQQVYVFYGEYESMEAARSARDGISDALKGHNPYVLSVPVALQKSI